MSTEVERTFMKNNMLKRVPEMLPCHLVNYPIQTKVETRSNLKEDKITVL
jgi:hypothetical protein